MARSLLSLFPAASALLAFRPGGELVPQPAFTEAGFAIAVHGWSFREFTLFEAVEMTAAAGAGAIELYPGQTLGGPHGATPFGPGMPEEKLRALTDHLKEHHITAINLGVIDIPKNETKAREIFEFAEKLGLHGLTTESLGSLEILEKLAAEFGITVGFHNHPKPTALWHPDTLWQALDGCHGNVGICADVGHWASSGLDPLEVVRRCASRIVSFHLKDRASITEWSRDQPLGTGVIDIPAILDAVLEHGFHGNVTLEYEANWQSNVPDIAQGVGYLRAFSKLRGSRSL